MLLMEGQVCECEPEKQFCTQCGTQLIEGNCTCEEVAESVSEPITEPDQAVPNPSMESPRPSAAEPEPPWSNEAKEVAFGIPLLEPERPMYVSEEPLQSEEEYPYDDLDEPEPLIAKKQKKKQKHNKYVEKPTFIESAKSKMDIPEAASNLPERDLQIVPDIIIPTATEMPIRQYHIANLRNIFRITRAVGYMQVTSKRLLFRAQEQSADAKTTILREVNINEITGLETASNYRFSPVRLGIGLLTIAAAASIIMLAVLAFTDLTVITTENTAPLSTLEFYRWSFTWFVNGISISISQVSLIIGLTIGFGGIALFFLLKGMLWFKLIFLGASLGGFFTASLTTNLYSYALLGLSLVINLLGLVLFATVADLIISTHLKSGSEINLVRAKKITPSIFQGHTQAGTGYAEIASTIETERSISELGAIISDVQTQGNAAAELWRRD